MSCACSDAKVIARISRMFRFVILDFWNSFHPIGQVSLARPNGFGAFFRRDPYVQKEPKKAQILRPGG
jgi:hypothetical protein